MPAITEHGCEGEHSLSKAYQILPPFPHTHTGFIASLYGEIYSVYQKEQIERKSGPKSAVLPP